jgi:hypothetical protein
MMRQFSTLVSRVLFSIVIGTVGCGAANKMAAAPPPSSISPVPLVITQQPQNATTPLGQAASFSVLVTANGTPSYQWSKNGATIPGATSSIYVTPAVTLGDSGSVFTVTVQDGGQSVTSQPATLAVGPRSPAAGDLRFQLVDSSYVANGTGNWSYQCCMEYPWGYTYNHAAGTPLRLGGGECTSTNQVCAWPYLVGPATSHSALNVGYLTDLPQNFNTDLQQRLNSASVVTSLDLESANDVFAISYLQYPGEAAFSYSHQSVALSNLIATVATDGAAHRVVTAVSFNDTTGNIEILSYAWAADASTLYDTSVQTTPYSGIGTAATILANAGYIITAFGGNANDGYILVGTRVHGDTLPRPIQVFPPTPASFSVVGYADVGQAFNTQYGNGSDYVTFLYEK